MTTYQTSRTKIVATLGPATDGETSLKAILQAGVHVVRLNFSHGDAQQHAQRAEAVRRMAKSMQHHVGIMADLQGPKIRIGAFRTDSVSLQKGQPFRLVLNDPDFLGDATGVYLDCPAIHQDVAVGSTIVLDDGRIHLLVQKITDDALHCEVANCGVLTHHKGMNILGGGLSAPCFTAKDAEDLTHAMAINADFVALSFVKSAQDVLDLRAKLDAAGSDMHIIAKIETTQAIEDMDAIAAHADGLMIARGDLAVEIGAEKVPAIQKRLVECARQHAKPVIVATQMMESMITSPTPTRAEVSDVANAVLDGVDAVMLSAETAVGDHPSVVIETMHRICLSVEHHVDLTPTTLLDREINHIQEGIAFAAMYTANQLGAKCLASLTESGTTARWMSRIRSNKLIYGISRHPQTLARMALYKGVVPLYFDVMQSTTYDVGEDVIASLLAAGYVQTGECVVVTKGERLGVHGGTNSMKVMVATSSEEQ